MSDAERLLIKAGAVLIKEGKHRWYRINCEDYCVSRTKKQDDRGRNRQTVQKMRKILAERS